MLQHTRERRDAPAQDRLFFLTEKTRSQWGAVIEEALESYPPRSTDRAVLRLFSCHYARGAPGMLVRGKTMEWLRSGYTHDMIVAACVVTAGKADIGDPFAYTEAVLKRWKQGAELKVVELDRTRREASMPLVNDIGKLGTLPPTLKALASNPTEVLRLRAFVYTDNARRQLEDRFEGLEFDTLMRHGQAYYMMRR